MENLNYNMEAQKRLQLSEITTDTTATHEISEEFDLPDYIPELRRLLMVKASVLPESKYLSDKGNTSQLDFGGTVTYLVIYTDDEGKLSSTPLSSTYEASTQLNSKPSEVIIDTVCDNTTARVNAPRRLTLKTRLKTRILGIGKSILEESISPKSMADEMYLQRAGKKIKAMEISQVALQNLKLSDKLDMQDHKSVRPIWCDASLTITECKPQNKSILVKGEATIKCACISDGKEIVLKNVAPISEEIEAENCTVDDMASVQGRCLSLSISNETNGDTNQLFFDLSCELEGIVTSNRDEYITVDCYSTKYETEAKYKIIDTYSVIKNQNLSFSLNEAVKRKNNELKEIIEVIANPVCEKTEIKGQKATLNGKLELSVIGKSEATDEKESEYLSDTYEIPFKYDCDLGSVVNEIIVRNTPSVSSIKCRYDNEKLYVNCEIYLSQSIIEKSKQEALDIATINKDAEIKNDASCIQVYFPKDGDTIWEIAKKYHSTVNKIAEQNEIEASCKITKSLII